MQNYNSKIKIYQIIGHLEPKTYNLKPDSGFTLVEILVAATIIALLSTIGITGFQAVTRSGRDALRKADLEQVRSALEIYKSENNSYPVPTGSNPSGLVPDYLNKLPTDPKSPTYRYYYTRTGNLSYELCTHLENGSTSSDSTKCGDSGGTLCTGNCNYEVTNP